MSTDIEELREKLFALEAEAKLAKYTEEHRADLEAQARAMRLRADNAAARKLPFAVPTADSASNVEAQIAFVMAPGADGSKPSFEVMVDREEALAAGWDPRRAYPTAQQPTIHREPAAAAFFARFGRDYDEFL